MPLRAQNPDYAPGDLVLFFQNPGGATGATSQLFANLGNTALIFRDAAPGSVTPLASIGDNLAAAFGAGWAGETTLYGGLGGVWSTSEFATGLQNGDPGRTVYSSQQRSSIGTVGAQNSTGYSIGGNTAMTTFASSVFSQNNLFERGATGPIGIVEAAATGITIANQNPAGGNGWNNIIPAPGVQQQGSASSFGTYGTITNVEFMWDLYRLQGRNDITGQYGFGGAVRQSEYLGTVVLDRSGNVSFVAAGGSSPSPSISLSGSLVSFSTSQGTASASQPFAVSGADLTGNVTLAAPAGFELSTDNTTFFSPITIAASGTLESTTVYVRVSASAVAGPLSGNITASSNGAAIRNLAVSGNVSAASPYDSWAADVYGLDPLVTSGPAAGAPTADPDNDGFANSQEFAFGTSPIAATGALVSAALSGGNIIINAWQRDSGMGIGTYELQTRADLLSGNWAASGIEPVPGNTVGAYRRMTYTVPNPSGRGFFRLVARE